MKTWLRYGIAVVVGIALGLGALWLATNRGFMGGAIANGPWQTSLNYGIKSTDAMTRAAVARGGLLALPATETVYWQTARDSAGAALDGKCVYRLSGRALDARWWSVTIYDEAGYLMPNAVRVWSVNGANVPLDAAGRWQVTIAPTRPASGGWLPSDAAQPFHLTLRMYNPGRAFMANPDTAELPRIEKEGCA